MKTVVMGLPASLSVSWIYMDIHSYHMLECVHVGSRMCT